MRIFHIIERIYKKTENIICYECLINVLTIFLETYFINIFNMSKIFTHLKMCMDFIEKLKKLVKTNFSHTASEIYLTQTDIYIEALKYFLIFRNKMICFKCSINNLWISSRYVEWSAENSICSFLYHFLDFVSKYIESIIPVSRQIVIEVKFEHSQTTIFSFRSFTAF